MRGDQVSCRFYKRIEESGVVSGTHDRFRSKTHCKNRLDVPCGETAEDVQGSVLMFIDLFSRMAGESG